MAAIEENDDDDREEDQCYTDIGFMFEGSEKSTLKYYEFSNNDHGITDGDGDVGGDEKTTTMTKKKGKSVVIKVAMNIVDDEPGAMQSGHYLWPAAPSLVQYLISLSTTTDNEGDSSGKSQSPLPSPQAVLELGSGCGLGSIAALQIFSSSIRYLVMTDHDPGTLERAEKNYNTTKEYLLEEKEEDINDVETTKLQVRWEILTWGAKKEANNLLSDLQQHQQQCSSEESNNGTGSTTTTTGGFDLIIGSDLIYDVGVVKPLFVSVSLLLDKNNDNKNKSRFILSQSFAYDDETEQEINNVCFQLGILRFVIQDNLLNDDDSKNNNTETGYGRTKIQEFYWK